MRDRNYTVCVSISSVKASEGSDRSSELCPHESRHYKRFSRTLAAGNAKKGITVNIITPGYIDTEMVQAVLKKVMQSSSAKKNYPPLEGRGNREMRCVSGDPMKSGS